MKKQFPISNRPNRWTIPLWASNSIRVLVLHVAITLNATAIAADLSKVVIIKADDFTGTNGAWSDFLEVSRAAGVKVSIGVITKSIQENSPVQEWMRAQENNSDVEFWNHGWDHKGWITNGLSIGEFQGSGLARQREHLIRSQASLKMLLGHDVIAFGSPGNGFDSDTALVMNESAVLRLFFTYTQNNKTEAARKLLANRIALLDIVPEADGTGKPNAAKLAVLLAKRPPGPVSLQFHPPRFDAPHLIEYKQILADLKAHGYTTMLPAEFVASLPARTANPLGTR